MEDKSSESDEAVEATQNGTKKTRWNTLSHNGFVFAELYKQHHIPILYDGEEVKLEPLEEEIATHFAQMLDHEYTKKPKFRENFFVSWRRYMTKENKKRIVDLDLCDFSKIYEYTEKRKEEKKKRTKEEKEVEKKKNKELEEEYGYAILDTERQKIGNFRIEPPGLYRGRGEHPLMGTWKRRVNPWDIILNIGKGEKIPDPPYGIKWKEVRHDRTVVWLASWVCPVTADYKYVMLSPSSRIRQESDIKKFEQSRQLRYHINRIRGQYHMEMEDSDEATRQRGTILYLIDKLALRVGNEKDKDEADTVGVCSLRKEHVTLHKGNILELKFLAKDSIPYHTETEVESIVWDNIKSFLAGKKVNEPVFDLQSPPRLNAYLKTLLPGLSAKVFRTYNASLTLDMMLRDESHKHFTASLQNLEDEGENIDKSIPQRITFYNHANKEVAVLCNHQKTLSKNFNVTIQNMKDKQNEIRENIEEMEKHIEFLKKNGDLVKKRTKRKRKAPSKKAPAKQSKKKKAPAKQSKKKKAPRKKSATKKLVVKKKPSKAQKKTKTSSKGKKKASSSKRQEDSSDEFIVDDMDDTDGDYMVNSDDSEPDRKPKRKGKQTTKKRKTKVKKSKDTSSRKSKKRKANEQKVVETPSPKKKRRLDSDSDES